MPELYEIKEIDAPCLATNRRDTSRTSHRLPAYYQRLGFTTTTIDLAEIEAHYRDLKQRNATRLQSLLGEERGGLTVEDAARERAHLHTVLNHLEEAYFVLSSPERRARYDAAPTQYEFPISFAGTIRSTPYAVLRPVSFAAILVGILASGSYWAVKDTLKRNNEIGYTIADNHPYRWVIETVKVLRDEELPKNLAQEQVNATFRLHLQNIPPHLLQKEANNLKKFLIEQYDPLSLALDKNCSREIAKLYRAIETAVKCRRAVKARSH
jgi:hypothetical protein